MGNAGSITIGAKIETKQFDKQIDYIESRLEEIEYQLKQADLGFEVGDTQKLEQEYEKLSNKLVDLRNKKQEVSETSIDDGGISTQRFGDGIEKITKKIARMGLAMIGIRSLYGMISSSVSRITEENPQLQAQIEGIRNAIDNVVAKLVDLVLPVIELIVSKVGDLLKGLFGIDISSKNFNNNMKSANKTISKIRKQLLGFDEMNILNKDGTIGGLGSSTSGGGTTPTPTQKTKKLIDLNSPGASDFFTFGAKDWIELPSTKEFLKKGVKDFIEEKDNILTRGAGSSVWKWLFGSNEDEAKADYTNVIQNIDGLSDNMKKLLHLPDDFNTDNLVDEFMNATTEINGDIVSVKTKSGKVIKLTKKQYTDLMESIIGKSQYGSKEQQKDIKETKKTWFDSLNEIMKKYPEVAQAILDGNYQIKKDYVEVKTKSGEVVRYSIDEFKKLQNKLTNVGDEGVNSANKTKKGWFERINEILAKATGEDDKSFFGGLKSAFNNIENESSKSGDNTKKNWSKTIVDLINDTKTKVDEYNKNPKTAKIKVEQDNQNNTKTTIDEVKKEVDKTNKNPFVVKLISKMDTSKMMETIRKLAKSWPVMWQPILNKLESYGFAKGGIINPPRLAKGGIINRPGRGVPIAVGGERGREAIVPLTDSQQMAYLGKEIAKNIVVNLTNVTELDGRQIALTTAKVMNEMAFQSNGGVM